MTVDVKAERSAFAVADLKRFVGHFVRWQGPYGSIAVVGQLNQDGLEAIANSKRLFPRDGLVEIQGVNQHGDFHPGDWVEFDVVKNTRYRAPAYKALHLKRLPRFVVLPESTLSMYRDLLTREGWSGDARPGFWAFHLAGDTVIVVELEAGKDGRLRVSRTSAREVKRYHYAHERVIHVNSGVRSDEVFIASIDSEMASLDWSDDVDHIARVVNSLAGMNDPKVSEIIRWLELHQEVITDRVSAASDGREPVIDTLRSAALANRLRADYKLMEVYLTAVLHDEAVRDVVAAYVREGHGAERAKLRSELSVEIASEKARRLAQLLAELEVERTEGISRIEQELEKYEAAGLSECDVRLKDTERAVSSRIQALEASVSERSDQLERQIAEQVQTLMDIKAEVAGVEVEREELRAEAENAQTQLTDVKGEVDRLLAIAEQLGPTMISAPQPAVSNIGIGRTFPNLPKVGTAVKGQLITRQVMLSDKGRELLQSLAVMLLSGELPILVGGDATDLLRVAESIICPGRFVSIEADPTLISLDDLWARPGSGVPTLLAAAAEAAKDGGAILVVIRGVERSGARFWMPALSEVLRSGGLPRGLFVCCTIHEPEHDELRVLRGSVPWLEITNVFSPGAALAGLSLLVPPRIELEMLDPGEMPMDLSEASSLVLELGENLSLDIAMRSARMFAEAVTLLGDTELAQRIVLKVARQLVMNSN
ncbi:hypothetical protein DNJ95_02230 [Stutzerimonas kirkiae]|uniref:Uncharacterized protein n=1 Tax=Stutzerimonas kirkiae TaxID=2211392 RepID=A0A4Q9RG26_9GAMM|nr:hypothetical protein [Stutzerimonas kirkiae]TBV00003.1 hypothetical protein DNJ96_01560 [Stutzerimonas kirkiae]TBV05708.1 hypothetical protein DNJ95_02230 [Stutzerimonas kirkiae]